MKKGDKVKFNMDNAKVREEVERVEWSISVGDSPDWSLRTWRPSTHEESRLPPRTTQVQMPIDGEFIVERARCRVALGWGNPEPGMARILNPETGEHSFVKREMLEVVQ